MRPKSDEERHNRRGCFIFLAALVLVLLIFGYFGLSHNNDQRTRETLDRYGPQGNQ